MPDKDFKSDGVPEIARYEHDRKNVGTKKVDLWAYLPGTDEKVRITALDNGDGTYSLKTTATISGEVTVEAEPSFSDSGGIDRKALVDADRHVQADILSTVLPTASTATDVSLASAATSAQLLAANASRKGLLLTNTDANAVYVYYGTTATATKFTVIIQPNAYWEMPQPIYPGRIDAIWAANGSGSLIGSELS